MKTEIGKALVYQILTKTEFKCCKFVMRFREANIESIIKKDDPHNETRRQASICLFFPFSLFKYTTV